MTNDEFDEILKEMILSCVSEIKVKPSNPKIYNYWQNEGHLMRTCKSCKCSQFQSKDDGHWIVYLTKEALLHVCDYWSEYGEFYPICEKCREW